MGRNKQRIIDDRIDYDKHRTNGYDGIEFQPEIFKYCTSNDFIRWLKLPQIMVWSWCFSEVTVLDLEIDKEKEIREMKEK
jgi:hypothetical protein